MMKQYMIGICLLFIQTTFAQTTEKEATEALKKSKCLSQMTNCDTRQAYYQQLANYWQCYLDNYLTDATCRTLVPQSKVPDCMEDDINFPTEASTKFFMDKCMVHTQVFVARKPVQSYKNSSSNTGNTASTNSSVFQSATKASSANVALSGTYFIANESYISGNLVRRIQVEEDRINDRESQFTIISEGQEVLSTRRRNNATEFTGVWEFINESSDPKLDRLKAKRKCRIQISDDGGGFTLTLQNIKFRPVGGLFVGIMQAWDNTNKGMDANTAANAINWEIASDKGEIIYEYIRKQ